MEQSLLDKLVTEARRYHSKEFLEAAMAVCALAAVADDEVVRAEHEQVEKVLAQEPALQLFDAQKAIDLLFADIYALRSKGEAARQQLYAKIRAQSGNHKRDRTLMRVAYLIILADGQIRDGERTEFANLCRLLGLEPEQVWQEMAG